MDHAVNTLAAPDLVPAAPLAARLRVMGATGRFAPEVIERFAAFVLGAPDEALFRASPFRVAAHLGIEPQEGLDLFLHATLSGILEFTWGVLCPYCAALVTTPGGLRALQTQARCQF
jgi:hypothetical protein